MGKIKKNPSIFSGSSLRYLLHREVQHGLSLFSNDGDSLFEEKPVTRVFTVASEDGLGKIPQKMFCIVLSNQLTLEKS